MTIEELRGYDLRRRTADSRTEYSHQVGRGRLTDYGKLRSIRDVGQVPNETWLLSQVIYQNSVCRFYDQWEVKV
jgi:hypothetical protein